MKLKKCLAKIGVSSVDELIEPNRTLGHPFEKTI
jgi:hypothetical protein